MKTHPMVVKASTDDIASTSESPVLNVNRETTWDSEGHSVNVGEAQSVPHEDGRLTHADIAMLNEANEGIQNQNCMANLTQGVTEEESKDLTASQALRKGSYGSVAISESVWSFPLVFGLARAGRFDSVYSVLLLLLNLGMQAMFSGILMSEGFMGSDFSHEARCVSAQFFFFLETRAGHGFAASFKLPSFPLRYGMGVLLMPFYSQQRWLSMVLRLSLDPPSCQHGTTHPLAKADPKHLRNHPNPPDLVH